MTKGPGGRRLQALVLESMVVVVSILLAFALDAWWDERGAVVRERQILAGVLEDLRSNRAQREARIELGKRSLSGTSFLLDALVGSRAGQEPVSFPDTVAAAVLIFPTYDPLTSSLDELLASEGFSGLSDLGVQRLLAAWRQQYDDLREDQELMLALLPRLAEGLSDQAPIPSEFWDFTPWVRDGASSGRVFTVWSHNPSLAAALSLKISFLTNVQTGLKGLGVVEEELIARIEEILATG